jgi:uncharacterized protein YqjF (DUF2071 family)
MLEQPRVVGRQSWRELLFVHWPVPLEIVRSLIPPGLTPDLLDGVAYVGLVPFAMTRVRLAPLPEALGLDLLETNVRLYVTREGQEAGVYFLSLDASSRLAVTAARALLGLPYHLARMELERKGQIVWYQAERRSGRRPRLRLRWEIGDPLGTSLPGTPEHFLLERYQLYVQRFGTLLRVRVRHPPYPTRQARILELEDQLVATARLPVTGAPAFVHYSPGVDVEFLRPERA